MTITGSTGSHVLKIQASVRYANLMLIETPKMIHIFPPQCFCGIDHMEGIKSTLNTSAAQTFSSVTLIIIQHIQAHFCEQSE